MTNENPLQETSTQVLIACLKELIELQHAQTKMLQQIEQLSWSVKDIYHAQS